MMHAGSGLYGGGMCGAGAQSPFAEGDRTVVEIDVCPSTAEQLETIGEQNIPWPSNDDTAMLREALSRTNSGFSTQRSRATSRAVSFERGVHELVRKLSPPAAGGVAMMRAEGDSTALTLPWHR